MMAAAEADFFSSAPVFMHHLRRLVTDGTPPDLIINSFTLSGVALLCGEAHGIPVAGFCAQPSSIPSDDAHWQSVIPIDSWGSGGLSLIDVLEEKLFTSHSSLKQMRKLFERTPFSSLSLRAARAVRPRGLEDVEGRLPLAAPRRHPDAAVDLQAPLRLARLLRHHRLHLPALGDAGGGTLAPPIAAFTDAARAGRKLMVMTFSSMPVPRAFALGAAVEMLEKSKHDFSLLYVGKRQPDAVPEADERAAERLAAAGKLLEVERADFGVLFRQMDAFVVHGGLGTTVEALRMRKPVAVTGILLMDQRFWGKVCFDKGVGPEPKHIDEFRNEAVDWADRALDPDSDYSRAAAALRLRRRGGGRRRRQRAHVRHHRRRRAAAANEPQGQAGKRAVRLRGAQQRVVPYATMPCESACLCL